MSIQKIDLESLGKEPLDKEWIDLIKQAKQLGIPLEKVRKFLQEEPENS